VEPTAVQLAVQRGHVVLPRPHPKSPGWAGLLVALCRMPAGASFAPAMVDLWIRDECGLACVTRLAYTQQPRAAGYVCPGRVVLHDRADGRVYYFTFGGSLAVAAVGDPLVYLLASAAPILRIGDATDPIAGQVAIEAEVMLAQTRARWGRDDAGFQHRLAHLEPQNLYGSTLQAVLDQLKQAPALQSQSPDLVGLIHRERRWLQERGLWPAAEGSLAQMLAPGSAQFRAGAEG
jgi:hypothetical protein